MTTESLDLDSLLSPREAYEIASQWGSLIATGDPGAVFYTFPVSDATPRGPKHRADLVAYTRACLADIADDDDREELESLLEFFEKFPDSGEEHRETYAAESQAVFNAASAFARAYVGAALFCGVEYRHGDPRGDHDRLNDLSPADIDPDTLRDMVADADAWAAKHADLLAQAYARDGYGDAEQAGHDFWLTRNGHGAGFWDRTALDAGKLGKALSDAAHKMGEASLYQGDDGGVYGG